MHKTFLITMGALALLTAPAFAQDASSSSALPSTAQQIAPLPVSDPQDFVNKAAVGNLFEVQSSQLALTQASDATVKQFAQQMVTDHTNADRPRPAACRHAGQAAGRYRQRLRQALCPDADPGSYRGRWPLLGLRLVGR